MNIFLVLAFLGLFNTAHAQDIVYSTSTAPELLEAAAVNAGIYAPDFIATAECESHFVNLPPHWDVTGDAWGIYQFHWSTFYDNAARAGISNPDITNPMQQIQVAAFMFAHGNASAWTCWRKLGNRSG